MKGTEVATTSGKAEAMKKDVVDVRIEEVKTGQQYKMSTMVENRQWDFTVDTGASVSCLSERVFSALSDDFKSKLRPLTQDVRVRVANGQRLEVWEKSIFQSD